MYPPSLFEENGKNVLPKPDSPLVNDPSMNYIVDGGLLLHRVIWPVNLTCKQLYGEYVTYVKHTSSYMVSM